MSKFSFLVKLGFGLICILDDYVLVSQVSINCY